MPKVRSDIEYTQQDGNKLMLSITHKVICKIVNKS